MIILVWKKGILMSVYITSMNRFFYEQNRIKPDSIISIVNPTISNPDIIDQNVPILKLKFHDICFEPKSFYDKERYTPPTMDHIDDIFNFGAAKYKKDTILMVHCFAGISRSSAAAIIALCPHYGYQEAVRMVADFDVYQSDGIYEKGSSWFMPNNLMIKYADERLALDGALVNLVEGTFAY